MQTTTGGLFNLIEAPLNQSREGYGAFNKKWKMRLLDAGAISPTTYGAIADGSSHPLSVVTPHSLRLRWSIRLLLLSRRR